MSSKLYLELSKLPPNDVNEIVFLLATQYYLIENDNQWDRIKQLNGKELNIILQSALMFIFNIIDCTDNEFYKLWGNNKTTRYIRELCQKYPLKEKEKYKVTLRIQAKLNETKNV